MAKYALDASSVPEEVLLGLTVADYFNGPTEDRDRRGELLWEFAPDLDLGEDLLRLYVKVKTLESQDFVVCFGFHEAEKPVRFPYRRSG